MKNSNIFFNELRQNNGAIWVEENDAIHLFIPKKFHNQETNDFIKNNKNQLTSVLKENQIFSEESFLDTVILRNSHLIHYPLSPAQERLWFIEQYEEGTNAYHMPSLFELENDTDKQCIKYALQQVVARHEILRSTIEQGDNEEYGIQVVHDAPLAIEEITVNKDDIESLVKEDINRPFDLSAEYPIRVKFYTLQPDKDVTGNGSCRTLLLINMHHIASDGWSIEIFQKELFAYYEAFVKGDREFKLRALEIQYKDYAAWQKDYLRGEILEEQLSYWKEKLSGYQTLSFPTDYVRPNQIDYRGTFEGFVLNREISKKLRAIAQRHGTTLHSVLLSSMNILLGKYTGQDDIITGSPIANRHHRQTEGLIGFFVNTQVNRTLLNKNQSFEALIQQVHQQQVEAQLYQDLPFEKLIVELGIERDPSRNPVFQVMFVVQSFGSKSKVAIQEKQYLKPYQAGSVYETTKFDLSIFIDDSQEYLFGYLSYATSLFHKDTIKRFIQHFTYLLDQLTEAPGKPYHQFSLLHSEEYDQIIYKWNETDKEYPKEKTVCQLFQEQAEKNPGNIALVYEGQQLTYKELNEKSNQLARHIRAQYKERTKQELDADTLIGLCLDRSLEMVIGILAVLKAGGAYVPIDTNYPTERINYILEDTRAELVLSQRVLAESSHLQLLGNKIILIDLVEELYRSEDTFNLPQHSHATDLAYVIYTSGTTGKPKGVMVEQRAISSLVYNDYIKALPGDVFAFLSSPVFDATTFEIWTPLLKGNRLVIPKDLKGLISDINAFKEFLEFNNISILWLTKTLFESIYYFDVTVFKNLNYLLIGGEALDRITVNKLADSSERPKHLLNGYGPTESTTFTCIYEINSQVEGNHVPIGKPINNRNTYILDANNNPVPIGVIGELYIGGAGLARGYLNGPDLTEERFISNPFATSEDILKGYTRLYKTGDLVRWLPDGNIEFIGRNDNQVKVRGYRVELGEIEHALRAITGIQQSCVLAKERKTEIAFNNYLIAYYVSDNNNDTLTQSIIFDKLSQVLPGYMLPDAIVRMESFPLTINGKLDKRALPDPDFSSEEYVAPTTETEIATCNIWQAVLGSERVGISDNFFRIGGNSILAIQVSHRMSKVLDCDVKIADIFRYKTISQLLLYSIGKAQVSIPKTETNQGILSFAQERLWFIEQYEQGTNAYHIPALLELENDTDIEGIKYALQQIVSRHEVLRSTIEQNDSQEHGIQIVNDKPLAIEEILVEDKEDLESLVKEGINRPFDLSTECPIRVKFYTVPPDNDVTGNGSCRTLLLINMHHIASDGWSMEIFQKELFAYYEAYIKGDVDFKLPALEIQYKDYAAWQRTYLTGEILEKQLGYWKEKLSGYPALELPTDYVRPNKKDYSGSSQVFIIKKEIGEELRGLAQRHGTTLHSVLLSSMNILLSNYTGQEDIITGSPTANRHHRQTEGLIGFFVNTQANRILLNKSQSFEALIQEVHGGQIKAQLHQDLPFEKLIDELGVERDPSRHPVFQVMFGVQSFGNDSNAIGQQRKYFRPSQAGAVYEVEKFDLTIFIDDSHDELIGQISYATSLFQKETIARFIRHYLHLVEQLAVAPGRPYRQISLLSPEEYDQILYQWNDTDKAYLGKNLVEICLSSITREKDRIAVVDSQGVYSYRQIGEYCYHVAGCLYDQNLSKTNCLIGVLSEKGYQQVVATLGIMHSGAAYLPLHVDWPMGRIDEVLLEGNVNTVLVSRSEFNNRIKGNDLEYKYDWKIIEDIIDYLPKIAEAQLPGSQPEDIAYVIFTSGSTGKPKGVIISHKGAVNTLLSVNEKFEINQNDKVLALSELSFDLSVFDIFGLLAAGGTIIFPDQDKTKEPEHWYELIKEHGITIWDTVPQLMQLLVNYATETNQELNTLKVVLMSGDWIPLRLPQQIKSFNRETTVMSLGGATEGSIWSIWYEVREVKPDWNSIPYGRAMPNQKMYVLNEFGEHCAAGLTGEIHIGGVGVALGYWNDEPKTNASFSFHSKLGRLYKTGDLGKWNRSGYIEFQGRKDGQVKIHGHRIELGEIEHALAQITGIKHSSVLAKVRKTETGTAKYLVAYYVLENIEDTLTQASIFDNLSRTLPEYMLPVALIEIESFPLTTNGKLDTNALPDPNFNSTEEYIAPTTEIEEIICRIWQQVLGLQKVGITDNFFRIGGDSILSIQVSSLIRQAGFNCQVKDIFECRTISKLAEHIVRKNAEISIKSEQGKLTGELNFLPIQQWFTEKISSGEIVHPNHWNQSFLIKVPESDINKLKTVVQQLVSYHDVFRIQFPAEHDPHSWKQIYQGDIDIPELKTLDISKHSENEVQEILTTWQSSFDLQRGPLFQAGYLYGYQDGSARIFFALHHMIVDAVSWRIITDDLKALYEGKQLPPKGSSYRQWVDTVEDYALRYPDEAVWWENQLQGMAHYPITGDPASPEAEFVEFDKALTGLLLQNASKAYHTEINDLLLTALVYALREINQQDIQGITLEGHGREDIDTTIDHIRTVGWFTSMFPVRLELQSNVRESIQFIKDSLRNIPNKGIGFGAFATANGTSYTHQNLPKVSFNYLGQFESQEGYWQVVSEGSGNSMHPANTDHNLVNINGMVSNSRLGFSIVTRLGKEKTRQLSIGFKTHLTKIVEHCIEKLETEGSSYTPGDFKEVHLSQFLLDQLQSEAKAHQNEITHIYPVNSLQQGFIYHVLSQAEDDAYRIQVLYDYHQAIDTGKYIKAWELCIAQYPILRTAFNWEEDIIQVIYKQGKLNYQVHDVSHLITQQERDSAIEFIQQEDRRQSFDLTKPTLLRLHIIKQSEDYYTIIKSVHHSISDGWSGPVLLSGLQRHYQALIDNKKTVIKEDTAYLKAQEYIVRHKGTVQDYWNKFIAGVDSANDINSLLSRSIDVSNYKQVEQAACNSIEITGSLYNELKAFSQKEGITINVILEFMWNKLLQVYSSSMQSIVGTTISGRALPIEGIEDSVGLYINTLPLIIDWDNENTIQAQLHQIQQKITEMNTNSFVDLAKLQKNGERIFHSLFVFENYPFPKDDRGLANISFRYAVEKLDYPLSLMVYENNNSLTIKLEYDSRCLDEEKAKQHLATLENILDQVMKNPAKLHKHIMLLSPEEYHKIIHKWNETDMDYREDKTIHRLFQEQAEKTPGNIALVYEGQQLTYKELNEKSNQLARYIRKQYKQRTAQELKPDTLVGLYLDRSLEMITGILAVLKAGAAYVPIDTNYPQERINYILDDTAAELILSQAQRAQVSQPKLSLVKVIHIDLTAELYKDEDSSNLPQHSKATDLAYVIYTSGTTGKPKGVMLNHSGIVNRLEWMQSMYPLHPEDVVLQKTPYVFDVSVWEILWANWYGAKIVIAKPGGHKDSEYLDQLIRENGVTTLHFVPAMLDAYNFYLQEQQIKLNSTIRQIFCSGEALHKNTVQQAYENSVNQTFRLHNLYGPTEASIDVTYFETSPNATVYIGRPIQNSQTYILDTNKNPVPIGVIGELYIGGAGLARGYLNRPDLTEERFIPNPFATSADTLKGYTRLYKTGDLVKWLPGGDIEYIGRNDDQVKIRGHRIELGEIEHALTQIPGIEQSCVLARERKTESGNNKYLLAYYVLANNAESPRQSNILEELSKKLPEYMVPGALVEMESFPLTINGKLDKRDLPDPDFNSSEQYAAPATEAEKAMCDIWQAVLGLERVGITDDFFRIGGDSILSIQVSGRMRHGGFSCQVKDIYECRTISKLAEHLLGKNAETSIKSEQGILTGELNFLPVQQWFTEKISSGEIVYPNHWNQSFLIKVPESDINKLKTVIPQLVSYHDVFRIQFPGEHDPRSWKQIYQRDIDIPELKALDISKHSENEVQEILTTWQSSFDLQRGPLFQAGYLYGYQDGSARIFFALHHMIVDAVSWRIITDDLKALYEGKQLPPKGSSYRQWVTALQNYPHQYPGEAIYWENQLWDIDSYRITGHPVGSGAAFFELDKTLTGLLLQNASKAYHTEINDLLLTALVYALKEINQQDIQGITLEGHGREGIDTTIDHSRTVGWFTSMFPVRLELQSNVRESIQFIKDSLRNIPNKGIGFGAFATTNGSSYTHQNMPRVSFNYLGQFESQEGYWQIVTEGSGNGMHPANTDHTLVNINGMVSSGRLGFSITTRLGEEKTRQLGIDFKFHLTKIIEHCIEKLETEGSSYTPGDFKEVHLSQLLLDRLQSEAKASQNEIAHIYPATSLQQGFIYHVLSQAEDDAYRVQVLYDYHQAIDTGKYIKAWELCIAQYPTLRTAFNWEEDIIQVIYKQGKLNYQVHDVSHLITQQERDSAIEFIQQEDRRQSFDLTKPTLLRLHIIKQFEDYYTIIKSEHHSISDGWSRPVLLSTVHQHYKALTGNHRVNIKEDRAYLQTQEYITRNKGAIQDYWNRAIAGVDRANDINSLLSRSMDVNKYRHIENPEDDGIEITGGLYNKLKAFSQKEGITVNVIIQFIWHKLLQVYSGSKQSIVGTTISGRALPIEGIEESVGLYINTLPLIIDWDNENTIQAQLYQIQQKIAELNTNSFADLAKLQKNGEQIFHSLFVYENYPLPKGDKGISNISFRNAIEKVNYPLSIIAYEYNDSLSIKLQYDSHYLSEEKTKQHLATLENMLDQVINNPAELHKHITLLSPKEYHKLIYGWNETYKEFPRDKTVYQLFQEQAEKSPDHKALVYEGQQLTYKELNAKSNQLARHIRKQYQQRTKEELKPDTLIALFLDRSLEMVIGILAVLKAGGAYVPMDTNYPQDRLNYILEDTRAELVLSQRDLGEGIQIELPKDKVIYIDLPEELYKEEDTSNLLQHSQATDLAYVIYTSGTTGNPKGVLVEHKGLVNLVFIQKHKLEITSESKVLQYASLVFDASVWEIFSALSFGAELSIIPANLRQEAGLLCDYLANHKITIALLPPVLLSAMPNTPLEDLKTLLVGGDQSSLEIMSRWCLGRKLINAYGPTENTVIATMHVYQEGDLNTNIGKPIDNAGVYVLDGCLNPVPVGVIGELYIGGAGLARGYLNRPDLTDERFIPNPFATQADQEKGYDRLYKTGDLVRWLPDGNIAFIGRNDDQVKIRGYRIELGEIEHALSQITGIKQSCVLAKERKTETGSIKYLAGYYVPDNNSETLTQARILQELSKKLPEYMVPVAMVKLESYPLTINGKLDKQALPDPDFNSSEEYIAPATETEEIICNLWQEVLGLQKVGVADNFFRIGGNSILAIQVSHRMSKVLGLDVKVADVFKRKTISQLLVYSRGKAKVNIPTSGTNQAIVSFAQERLWFIEKYEQGTNAYHIPVLLELEADTDIEGIKYALQQIVARHEVLRSTIQQNASEEHGIQVVHGEPLAIKEINVRDKDDLESLVKEDINRPFDLSTDYPVRVKFYKIYGDKDVTGNSFNKTLLLINMHHIAGDGWSIEIFQKELFAYYEAYVNSDREFKLPALEIQYKDYAAWQRNYLTGEILEKQLSYWKEKLSGYQKLELPADYIRPAEVDYRGSNQVFTLNKEISKKIRALAQRNGTTLHSVLLSSMNILFGKYTGQEDIVLGTPIANRHHQQTEGLIGFFVNTQVNRTLLNKTQSFEALIKQVHQDQIEAQLHQDLPFEKLIDELGVERDPSRHPVFQVMFGVQNFGSKSIGKEEQKNYFKPFQAGGVYEVEKFDLTIFINDSHDTLIGQISYATSLFHKDTIERFIRHYTYLLDQLTETPELPYSQISLLHSEEYNQIIYRWNETDKAYPQDKTLDQLFQEQAEKTPGHIALVYEGQQLTYRELNEKSNQLAWYIRKQYLQRTKEEFKPDTLIPIYLDRSLEMVIGILAVLKAGGAYVPMDTNYPQERINYILEDTRAEIILSQRHVTESSPLQLPEDKVSYIDLSEMLYNKEETLDLPQNNKAKDLAYVIYTSGTTGKPKGVMMDHQSVSNRILYMISYSDIIFSDYYIFKTNYVFDVSVSDIFTHLFKGAKILITKHLFDLNELTKLLLSGEFTSLHLVPSQFDLISSVINKDNLQKIYFSGEALTANILSKIPGNIKVYNYYGPTELGEITVSNPVLPNEASVIGKIFPNSRLYVLEQNRIPVPIGVIGELCIGGTGLARGYLNRPDLTEERFIPNPFATHSDKEKGYTRLYKTGDLVRWLPDGNLEFKGRNDDQVKIRGYRIEIREIEHALAQITGIKQSCVLAKERKTATGSTKYLAGFYVLDHGSHSLTQAGILAELSNVLPEYMLPAVLVEMDIFPLTINGKLDKRALPDPDFKSSEEYVVPTTEIEKTMCRIWQSVLGLERVGITDDFFRIGGNSILAIQVSLQMSKISGGDVKVADIFRFKCIHQLLTGLKDNQGQYSKLIKPYHFTQDSNSPDFVFVHPGMGGCEVYQGLADILVAKFNCTGIDNYNIHNNPKIDSLNNLAKLYLSDFELYHALEEPVNLLGWSSGGLIALEMSAILEMRGFRNINVTLLDTFIADEFHKDAVKGEAREKAAISFINMVRKQLEPEYGEKVISSLETEIDLANSSTSSHLKYTQITLFKAMQKDARLDEENATISFEHNSKLVTNNIELIADNVKVINLDCHHGNILDTKAEAICDYLLSGQFMETKMKRN